MSTINQPESPGIAPVPRDGSLPSTLQQEGMWFVHQLDPSSSTYHIAFGLRLCGELDAAALSRAVRAQVFRHEALRTRFLEVGGQVRQVIDPPPPASYSLPMTVLPAEQFAGWAAAEANRPMDLTAGPLFRAALARIAPDEHVLVFVIHHIVCDGWSVRVLLVELEQLYAAETGGDAPGLADIPVQPADLAVWQRRWLDGPELDRQFAYWHDKLAGLATVDFPTDRPRPAEPTGAGATFTRSLPDSLAISARNYASTYQVSFLGLLQAALLTVLHRYTGQDDLPIGSIFAGRTRPEARFLVGFFANTLVLRTDVSGNPTFAELIRRCHDTVRGASANEDVPIGLLIDALQPERVVGRNPLFQISLTRRPARAGGRGRSLVLGDMAVEGVTITAPRARFDIALDVVDAPGGSLELTVEYSTELFNADRMHRLLDHFGAALAAGLAAPDTAIGELDYLSARVDVGGWDPALDDEIAGLERQVAERADLERLLAERAELERLLAEKRARRANRARPSRVVPVPRDASMVCTYQQEGLWFLQQLNPDSSGYQITFPLRLRGDLDVPALGRALHALVVRHEALRTRFIEVDGLPRQVVDPPPATLPLAATDVPAADVAQWATAEIARPTNLATGPVFRAPLARLAPDEHVLVLMMHHIVGDGWSARILAAELSLLYGAETSGVPAQLPDLVVQPADHAVWQRGWLDGAETERQVAYWRDALTDLSTVDFPSDRPRPAQATGAGAAVGRRLPDDEAAAAHAYAKANRVSFLAVLQAALLTVLHRYTGQQDLPIGSIFSGRTRVEIEPMVGYFINAVVLRTSVEGDPSFAELVQRCNETVLSASAHQDVPFGLVVNALRPDRIGGRNPLFQINLTLQPPAAAIDGLVLGGVTIGPVDVTGGTALFDVTIGVIDAPDGHVDVGVVYSTEMFDGDRMGRLLDHFTAALARGIADPDTAVAGLDVMSATERDQVVRAWNATCVEYPPATLPSLFVAAAARTPESVAVVGHDGACLTYGQLDRAANQLAHRLRHHGVGPGVRVGICLDRCADLVTALLATWKAGGAYVAFDPEYPADRLAFMLADAAPAVVVTNTEFASLYPSAIVVDAERSAIAALPSAAPDVHSAPDDLAYVLYTSGSTGTPKGVAIDHRGIYNRIAWMQDAYRLEPADRVLQKTPYSFDVSVWEFFWPLVTGATLVLAAPGGHRDPDYLRQLILREGVTTTHFVPTMLRAFLDQAQGRGGLGSLRRVFCSGEALPADVASQFLAAWPEVELHNLYGPTEASVDVTAWRCEPGATTVPIGHPIANMRAYVLDERLRPVPIGIPGQLFLAGVGLAQGYLNQPSLTAQRFLADPFADRPGQRMYATGDVVRWRQDGQLDYLGRTDRQIKLRGQRVELAEIEHVIGQHPKVRQCVAMLRDDAYIAAYVVGDDTLHIGELREYLSGKLPVFMIPTALVMLPSLPATANGKLDTERLPEPPMTVAEYVEPRTDTERWLAETWQTLLGRERVGAVDNFFELGGNSLHITQLIARVRDDLNLRLHPRHLFITPVLEQLATRLDEASTSDTGAGNDSVIPLQSGGTRPPRFFTRPPLFFVHPVGGSVIHYVQLAQALGDDQPFYAIEDPGLQGVAPAGTLAERASRYVEMIRRVRPQGPYHLGGWSLGGIIAVEMARQLAEAGENVAIVIALDCSLRRMKRAPRDIEVLATFVKDVAGTAGMEPPAIDLPSLGVLGRDALEDVALSILDDAGLAPPDTHEDMRTRMRVFAANIREYAAHQPRAYDGRLLLINAIDNDASDYVADWKELSPGLEHRTVPGNHFTILRPPRLVELAAVVREGLAQAWEPR